MTQPPEVYYSRAVIEARIMALKAELDIERVTPGLRGRAKLTEQVIDAELDLLAHCDDAES